MIQVAQRYQTGATVEYTGIDLFEARTDHEVGMPLKQAHSLLKPTGAQVRLVPGDAQSALGRAANSLAGTDLLIISSNITVEEMAPAWFFVPRMLDYNSIVLMEEHSGDAMFRFRRLILTEIERLASPATGTSRRAA